MNKKDIARMISLADDRYVDEIFQDRITGRRKNIFLTFTAVAAALAVVAGGISYFVSKAGDADKITVSDPIVSEAVAVDYSLYFQNHDEAALKADDWDSWSVGSAGIFCRFSDSEYVKSVMPFDTDSYTNANCNFFYDHKDEVKAILIHANNSDDNTSESAKRLYVEVYKGGEFFPHLALDRCRSMKRFDVDVYGFDLLDTEKKEAGVVFEMDGREYLIGGDNLSYDEIGAIMDSIITNGLWTDRFDISKAEVEYFDRIDAEITLAEANEISPFAGHVPQMQSLGDMLLNNGTVSYYAGRDGNNGIVPKWLYFTYFNGTDKDICLQYFTEAAAAEVQPVEKIVKTDDIELDKLSEYGDGGNYTFAIDYGGFKVNVWANNCTPEEMEQCIIEITRTEYSSITLAEANKIAPYEGYVPQNETVGDMKLGLVQYNGSNIVLDYSCSGGNRFSYIGLTYTADKRMTADYAVITLEQLIDSDIVINSDDSEDGRNSYKFAVECNGLYGSFYVCVDSEKCTAAELYDCILTLLMEKGNTGSGEQFDFSPFGSLADANKLAPFAGYVPNVKTIGDMNVYLWDGCEVSSAESSEYGRVLNIAYQSEATSGSTYGGSDFKAISLIYTDKKAYNIPTSPVISVEKLPWAILDNFETDGIREGGRVCYRFVIDCGTCYISAAADCLPEEMKQFISEITGTDVQDADDEDEKILTIDKIKELSKKGDDLMWDDFDGYTFTEGGFGLYIRTYTVEEGYSLYIGGGSPYEKPMYIHFGKGDGNYIDLRYDSVDEFLGEKVPLYAVDSENGNLLTIEKVKELAKKGEDLTWSDFEEFSGMDVGSGMYIMVYPVEGTDYRVTVGGSPDRKPMYINFGTGDGNYIDLRSDSLDDYLNEKPFINYEF